MKNQILTPAGEIVKGYKATDENMCCLGFQFELGKWYEHKERLELCVSGFHFCEFPSGPWAHYDDGRIFECEAEYVLRSEGPGAALKHVAKRIRLVKEIEIGGDGNTGDRNTGDRNTGDRNTGDKNTGDRNTGYGNTGYWNTGHRNTGDGNTGYGNTGYGNTGYWNTGYGNTGHRNTGDGNTGDRNTGDGNTGYWNTGHRNTGDGNTGDGNTGYGNTGHRNTGDGNTGHRNTGYWNTGYGNCGDYHSGFLCHGEAPFFMFNLPAKRSDVDMDLVRCLLNLLWEDDPIDPKPFLSLPNATPERIKALHNAHIAARSKKTEG